MKLSLVLKDKTEISHQQLEKLLVGKLKSIGVEKDYLDILKKFYGYLKPLEEEIDRNLDMKLVPDYTERRKSNALAEDIRHFGANENVELCKDLPEIANTHQALGALYVLEGSTLGGAVISKMVTGRLGLTTQEGVSFFHSYGEETWAMWEKFKIVLDAVPEDAREMVIVGADETFVKFRDWLA